MTTPTGQISMSDVALEIYGNATIQIDMEDSNVYKLAGVPTGSAISMSQLQGKSWISFSPASGTLSDTEHYPKSASVTITCTQSATWSFTGGSSGSSVSVANNASSTGITFSQSGVSTQDSTSSWSVTGTSGGVTATYTVILTVTGLE